VAASGGYYVAAAADRIVANPGSITGSIGVILQIPNVGGLLQKVGIKTTVIKAGENKDLGSITRDLTEAERQILQEVMDDVHGQFIDAVAQGRRMDRARVEPLADGRIFSGRQALRLGLVDELGDLPDAIERAGGLGGIPGRPKVIQERRRRSWLWELLTDGLGPAFPAGGTAPPATLQYLWR
jgi:protease-4